MRNAVLQDFRYGGRARHGGRTIGEKSVFFVVKSPCGDGDLAQDYNKASDAEEVIERLESKLDELSGEGE